MEEIDNIMLNEDDEPKSTEDASGAEEEAKPMENADDAEDVVENAKQPFGGLDLRSAHCFGFMIPEEKCWKCIADQAEDLGWKQIDAKQLEKSLTKDVEDSYLKIADFKIVNVDDDMAYHLWFDNNKALWGVEISDSPNAEISNEERAGFFGSEMFKKIAKKTYNRILSAYNTFNDIVKQHVDNGEMLLVDDIKLDAILHFLSLDYFLKNLLNGKYLG